MAQLNSFSVFPLDVWDILLNKYVIDSKSWLSCMYSSNLFQNDDTFKWKQNRIIRLLPEVLAILQTECKQSYLNDDDIKALRLVSKQLHFAVGKFSIGSPLSNRHVCGPTPRIWLFQENIDAILAHFASSTSELHQIKSFHIAEDLEFDDLQKVLKILEIVGANVRGLTWCTGTYIKCGILSGSEWYKSFRNLLNLVPNLECLQISVVLIEDFEELDAKRDSFIIDLIKLLDTYPLPKLEKLLTLKVDKNVPTELINVFLSQNSQTQIVQV